MQKIPREVNVSLSLAKRKLAEKNECLITHVRSRMFPYTSQIVEEASFFQLSYSEHDFTITNLVGLSSIF